MTAPEIVDRGVPAVTDGTEYVILSHAIDEDLWRKQGTTVARDNEAAIKQFLDGVTMPSGFYVAVPARSWKPVKVTPKVETTLVFEEAK